MCIISSPGKPRNHMTGTPRRQLAGGRSLSLTWQVVAPVGGQVQAQFVPGMVARSNSKPDANSWLMV